MTSLALLATKAGGYERLWFEVRYWVAEGAVVIECPYELVL